ncbi:hypothetical protein FB45DRAFT_948391 [Roridomyces roridus]|uniref:Uncharacterized protein n=1 Tax=Roridomyces roridus TaxID=1738132 RepID=A0AAD7B196_9AGAR|nr:hypothetical protein FB45DRAFT_948391 [Roridomyces roridus]
MSYPTAYPSPPPPTTNSLSSHQRTQLRRTTQKLGRILGTTPALIEESDEMPSTLPLQLQRLAVPLHVQLSSVYDDGTALNRYPSRSSSDSDSGLSSSSSSESHRRTRSVHQNPETYPKVERPFLRIAVGGKKSSKRDSTMAHPQSPPGYDPRHTSFTIPASRAPASFNAIPPPPPSPYGASGAGADPYHPSTTSARRHKMDRLRRTLGEGVPLDLVFREEEQVQERERYGTPMPPAYPHGAPPQARRQKRVPVPFA